MKYTIKQQLKLNENKEKHWINKEIMELCYQIDKLWSRWKQNHGNTGLKDELKKN